MRPGGVAGAMAATAGLVVAMSVSGVERGSAAIAAAPTGAGFELEHSRVRPQTAFFDGERRIRLRYRFAASGRPDLAIKVLRAGSHRPVRRWLERDVAPGRVHARRWDGRRGNGKVAADGAYELRVGPLGHRGARAGQLRFFDHAFPVAGPHTYGDRFGEARSGGRVHEGQDLPAACGTRLVAARGGRVQARGYSDALYGYWVLIDGRATRTDYFYSHLAAPAPLGDGDRVRTGERVGAVGKTGNARSEFCQLHFELWPRGYRKGAPQDPLGELRRWDEHS
jgi:murein DD-endopeptidase MepM/ murein hydrolase activator NlpD